MKWLPSVLLCVYAVALVLVVVLLLRFIDRM